MSILYQPNRVFRIPKVITHDELPILPLGLQRKGGGFPQGNV